MFRVQGSGFRVQGSVFRVQGSGLMVRHVVSADRGKPQNSKSCLILEDGGRAGRDLSEIWDKEGLT